MPGTKPHSTPSWTAHRPGKSIRQKLVFLMALLMGGISLFIFLFFPARFEQQAIETVAAKAAGIAEMSAYTLAPALDFNNVDEVEEVLQAALQVEDALYAYVQAPDGAFVASFLKDSTDVSMLVALGPEGGVGPDGHVYSVRRTIASRDQALGYLYMGFSLQRVNEALNRSRMILALVSLLVFLVGMGATYGISVFITGPLGQIVEASDRIAQGDLMQRAAVASNDEVGRLAQSFNEMVDSLESAYEASRTSEARFRAVIENATDIIGLVDQEGRLLYLSPSVVDVVGCEPESLVGRSIYENIHSDDQALLKLGLRQAVQSPGVTLTAEVRWRHRDGAWRYLSCRGRSLLDHPGIESILITARDITENKQFEQELVTAKEKAEEMVRLKNTILANMSHEIRTPLTGILGYAQVLRSEVGEEHRELVETISLSGRRLMNTLNSVLDLAQLEARSIELDVKNIDIVQEGEEAARLLRPLTGEDVTIEVVAPPAPVVAPLDQHGLRRILNNLIGNAIKFTQKGCITVEIGSDDRHALIFVRDTGAGISKEFLPHVFDEFKQESTGMSRSHEGNGLGLSITKQLTELMGGTISVESLKGVGTAFTLTFPRADTPAHKATPALPDNDHPATLPWADDRSAIHENGQTRAHVLVVEDNPMSRKMIEQMLAPHYHVESVASGSDALEAATNQRFDAVVMDINLGAGKDGVDTMNDLRNAPAYRHVPFIALTAYALPGDETQFLEKGFDDYLSKPFKCERLLHLLAKNLV